MSTCALSMGIIECLTSGCEHRSICLCVRTEMQACQPSSESCLVFDGGLKLVRPPILDGGPLVKYNDRVCCAGSRCALPCDEEVPCLCACLFLKCLDGYPHKVKPDFQLMATAPPGFGPMSSLMSR